jgi:hypothetical protein
LLTASIDVGWLDLAINKGGEERERERERERGDGVERFKFD